MCISTCIVGHHAICASDLEATKAYVYGRCMVLEFIYTLFIYDELLLLLWI